MVAPIAIEPTLQRGGMDCGIACLAMLLGLPYRTVRMAAGKVAKDPSSGLTARQLNALAKRLGHPLTKHPISDLDNATGIIWVKLGTDFHLVLLFNGSIYDPADGLLYVPEAYFAAKHAVPLHLLAI